MMSTTHPVVRLTLPADRPPWTPTGMHVRLGDQITLLGSGFVHWSVTRDEGAGAKYVSPAIRRLGRHGGALGARYRPDRGSRVASRDGGGVRQWARSDLAVELLPGTRGRYLPLPGPGAGRTARPTHPSATVPPVHGASTATDRARVADRRQSFHPWAGRATFSDIVLRNGTDHVRVL